MRKLRILAQQRATTAKSRFASAFIHSQEQDQNGLDRSAISTLDSGAIYPEEEYPGEIYLKRQTLDWIGCCTGLYWTVVGCTGMYWDVLGVIELYWVALG